MKMIIMLNGAFGVGKTTTANMLLTHIENSMIYDPEEVGFMLRNIITEEIKHPDERKNDFQAIALWRVLTVKVASEIKRKYKRNLIVPMTIRNYDYYNYIRDGFRAFDEELYHFCLTAKTETIHKRLLERGDKAGAWAFKQTEDCIEGFLKHDFSEYIDAEKNDPSAVVQIILDKVGHTNRE